MNKLVIVTGGSRGIGAATVNQLAKEGFTVCFSYRKSASEAMQLQEQLLQAGMKVRAYQADMSIEAEVISFFDKVESDWGQLSHLVNNAGILLPQTKLADISVERFTTMFNNNLLSCFLCCREAAKRMANGGAIVNVSSVAAKTGAPFEYTDYAACKSGMDALTKGLAMELAERSIRVNCIRPGFVYTDMHTDGGEPGRVDRLSSQIPLKRGGQPEEVANTISWLLSEHSSYITGSIIDVAGGR